MCAVLPNGSRCWVRFRPPKELSVKLFMKTIHLQHLYLHWLVIKMPANLCFTAKVDHQQRLEKQADSDQRGFTVSYFCSFFFLTLKSDFREVNSVTSLNFETDNTLCLSIGVLLKLQVFNSYPP